MPRLDSEFTLRGKQARLIARQRRALLATRDAADAARAECQARDELASEIAAALGLLTPDQQAAVLAAVTPSYIDAA